MICNMLLPASSGATAGGSSGGGSSSSSETAPVKGGDDGASTGGAAGIMTGAAAAASDSSSIALNAGTVVCTLDGQVSGSVSSLGLQNLSVAYYSQLGTVNIIGGSESQIEMIKDFIAETDKNSHKLIWKFQLLN